MQVAELLLRVGHGKDGLARNRHGPAVADLAAGLAVEGRLVRDDQDFAAGLLEAPDLLAARDQRQHFGFGRQRLVAEELRRAEPFAEIEPERLGRRLAGAGPGLAGLGAGAVHLGLEAVLVHAAPAASQHVARQVEREAVSVVEPEGDRARQRLAVAQPRLRLVEQPETAPERLLEALLFQPERL